MWTCPSCGCTNDLNNSACTYCGMTHSNNDAIEYASDGSIASVQHFNDDGSSYIDYKSGERAYFTRDKYQYRTDLSDGTVIIGTNQLKPNGTFYDDQTGKSGTYQISDDGTIICTDSENNISYYNQYGNIQKEIDKYQTETYYDENGSINKIVYSDGTTKENNYKKLAVNVYTNGEISTSRIGHIRYDETAYNIILRTLNEIDGSNISASCSSVEDSVGNFPDKFSSGFGEIGTSINGHINQIKSLSNMANYSILAYQTCDESLRSGLEQLVDSFFDESEQKLANNFKNMINMHVEDRNNDGIIEYKVGTNFYSLSQNVIVDSTYVDENGTKWYLSKNNSVLGIEGNDIHINYGNETFSVSTNDNGIMILKDSNGNDIDIFGDYNIDSSQFGGNQENLLNVGSNIYVENILNKYLPDLPVEDKYQLLSDAANAGCGKVALTNLVFKKFEGHEQEFLDTFGYPMYELKKDGDTITLDYNYEPMIVDLACNNVQIHYDDENVVVDKNNSELGDIKFSTNYYDREDMEEYLKEEYNVNLDDLDEAYIYRGETGYTLYNTDGSIYCCKDPGEGNHAMIEIGQTSDGKSIVSSWGRMFILELSTNEKDIVNSEVKYKKYGGAKE